MASYTHTVYLRKPFQVITPIGQLVTSYSPPILCFLKVWNIISVTIPGFLLFFQCFQISSLRQSFKEFIDTEKAPFCFKSQLINSSFMTGPSFPPLYKPLPCVYLFIINPGRPCCVTGHVKYSPP